MHRQIRAVEVRHHDFALSHATRAVPGSDCEREIPVVDKDDTGLQLTQVSRAFPARKQHIVVAIAVEVGREANAETVPRNGALPDAPLLGNGTGDISAGGNGPQLSGNASLSVIAGAGGPGAFAYVQVEPVAVSVTAMSSPRSVAAAEYTQ